MMETMNTITTDLHYTAWQQKKLWERKTFDESAITQSSFRCGLCSILKLVPDMCHCNLVDVCISQILTPSELE